MMTAMPSPARPLLTSTANPRVASVLALRERRGRDRTGLTLVDGSREVRRAVESGAEVIEAFVCEALLAGPDARFVLDRLEAIGTPTFATNEHVFGRLAFGERAEGIVAVVRTPSLDLADLSLPADALLLVVEAVEKPGNLGAILRSADGAGVDTVIAASPRTDLFNPNAIRASAGTVFAVPIAGLALLPILIGQPLLLTPMLIAFMELIIDPACSVVLEAEPEERDLMTRPPRDPKGALLSKSLMTWGVLQGSLALAAAASLYLGAIRIGLPETEVRTLTFIALVAVNLTLIFSSRTLGSSMVAALARPNAALGWGLGVVAVMLFVTVGLPTVLVGG